ncbi:hypothetical protein LR48_Vigan10g203000 [Vigna angularis]|uniref:Uncharacterized protein n=1 Tax=Phaseolus angularis TaxID=3914 RepID=A0A0L9VME2_PHAAN|nr:hypothetical protein LR48_Vigan10g203000 [Vigna angularis]
MICKFEVFLYLYFGLASALWRDFKTRLTRLYVFGDRQHENPCQQYTFTEEDWMQFRASRESEEWKDKRLAAQERQRLNDAPHVLSRGGYAKLEKKLRKSRADALGLESPDLAPAPARYELWKAARTKSDGNMTSSSAALISQRIFTRPQKQPIHDTVINEDDDMAEAEDDPLSKLMTKLPRLKKAPLELYWDLRVFGLPPHVPVYITLSDALEMITTLTDVQLPQTLPQPFSQVDVRAGTTDVYINVRPGTTDVSKNVRPLRTDVYINVRPHTTDVYINVRPDTTDVHINVHPLTTDVHINVRPCTTDV